MPYRPFGIRRTFLAILVLLQHFGHVGPAGMTRGRYATGSVAVLVFVTLPGFVITEAADRFYRGRPGAFLANHAIRILRQYLVALIGSAAVITIVCLSNPDLLPSKLVPYPFSVILAPFNIAQDIFMIFPDIGRDGPPLIPYVWALRVEMLFYFVLAIGLCLKVFEKPFCGRLLALATLALFILSLVRWAPYNFQYIPYFLLGVLSYLAVSERGAGAPWRLAPVFAACLWTCVTHSMPDFIPAYRVTSHEGAFGIGLYCALNGVFLLLINLQISDRWRKIDSAIGELSFPLYLQQYAALIFVAAVMPLSYVAIIVASILACMFAALAALGVEKPIRSFRDRIRGSRIHGAAHRTETGQNCPEAVQIGTMRRMIGNRPQSTSSPQAGMTL